jgi:hypothetical protein
MQPHNHALKLTRALLRFRIVLVPPSLTQC